MYALGLREVADPLVPDHVHRREMLAHRLDPAGRKGKRHCLSREGSANTHGKGTVLAAKAVRTPTAKALS